ncbi:MAG: DedA family protein [Thermoanaerobaculia bacterium]
MRGLFEFFLRTPAGAGIGLVFLLTAAETALLVGMVVPGEIAAILGGVLAGRGRVPYAAVAAAAISGAWVGDSVGFALGRRLGGARFVKRRRRRWTQARAWLKKKGGIAIFLARFMPFLRTFMPSAAGAARMPYARFLSWDLPTGILWGSASTAIGYLGVRDFEKVIRWSGRIGLLVLALAIAAVAVLLHRFRPQARRKR